MIGKLLICYGTRPEWIKVKPIIDRLKDTNIQYKTLFTGQHKDLVKESADYMLPMIEDIGNNRLDSIVSGILKSVDGIIDNYDYILVQGDTTSVFSIALAAFHRGKKIIHLEAGLRTYDNNNPYPEEFNRTAVSKMTNIHLCPTQDSVNNLLNEKVPGSIHLVGNTVLDNLVNIDTSYSNNVIVTLHRRENHHQVDKYFNVINKLAENNPTLNFILPIHPNPNVYKHKHILEYVDVINPVPYDEMIKLLANCKIIISDSGGIQEEASFFNKKVIVCREHTERPESVDIHSFLCKSPDDLENMFYDIINDYKINEECPYGDGKSSERIINILKEKTNVPI
tara:strand:+ start:890 stop:1906 length:1017 start_codon:yes stop_codon:yes gene_type:complete